MSEDCLNMNVIVMPEICKEKHPCPVLTLYAGGALYVNSPNHFPTDELIDRWASTGLVVVAAGFRLGTLGFWNTGTNDARGNYALYGKLTWFSLIAQTSPTNLWLVWCVVGALSRHFTLPDMLEGLRWIQKEISMFGGDPSQVTILGYSSGAVGAIQISLSSLSIGLFHQLIPMSPVIASPYRNYDEVNKKTAFKVGCAEESTWKADNFKLVSRMRG